LVVNYTDCNTYDVSWTGFGSATKNGSSVSSGFRENGNNTEALNLVNFTGSSTVGTVLATISKSGGKTINIVQIGNTWSAKSPVAGTVGTVYNSSGYQFTATGGTESYTVTSGSLPPGLTLATNGLLSGTPTTLGNYSFTVTKSGVSETTGSLTIAISGPVATKVTICHRTSAINKSLQNDYCFSEFNYFKQWTQRTQHNKN